MLNRHDEISKKWENEWTQRLPGDKPWVIRLDGRTFHTWTRGLERPFDDRLRETMVRTAQACATDAHAWHAYTQSDEITLVLLRGDGQMEAFGGKLQKMVSLLASRASVTFNEEARKLMPEQAEKRGLAVFDARAFAVPDKTSACVALNERAVDCAINAIQSVGQWHYGHKAMLGLGTGEVRRKLEEDGSPMTNWAQKHTGGVAIAKQRVTRRFNEEDLRTLPEKHAAHNNPDLTFGRTETLRIAQPRYDNIEEAMKMVFGWRETLVKQ